MQNTMQISNTKAIGLRAMIVGFLSVLTVALLFSCTKNVATVPNQAAEEATAVDENPHGKRANGRQATLLKMSKFLPYRHH